MEEQARLAIPTEKWGFNYLKWVGFQALLPGSILACETGEKGVLISHYPVAPAVSGDV